MQLTNDLSIELSIKFRLFPGHGGAMTVQFFRTRSEVAEMSSLALSKRFFRMEVRPVGRWQPWWKCQGSKILEASGIGQRWKIRKSRWKIMEV